MDKSLQRRLLIAIIIVAIAVMVVPMFFGHSIQKTVVKPTEVIPPAPPAPLVNEPEPIKDEAPVKLQAHQPAPIAEVQTLTPLPQTPTPGVAAIASTDHESAPVVPGASPVSAKRASVRKGWVTHHHVVIKNHHAPQSASSKVWVVQALSVPIKSHAEQMAHELSHQGFPAHVQAVLIGRYITYRVYVGPYHSQETAKVKLLEIKHKAKLNGLVRKLD